MCLQKNFYPVVLFTIQALNRKLHLVKWDGPVRKGPSLAKWGHKFSGKGIHIFQIRLDSKLYLKLHSKHFINRQASSEQMFPIKNEYMIFFSDIDIVIYHSRSQQGTYIEIVSPKKPGFPP